jgi:hypothetical protein
MLKNNRKGIELPMNMIVVSVMVLLVLLVMAFLLMSGVFNWNKGTDCENQGGKCTPKSTSCESAHPDLPVSAIYSCKEKEQRCCINIGGLGETK